MKITTTPFERAELTRMAQAIENKYISDYILKTIEPLTIELSEYDYLMGKYRCWLNWNEAA